MLVSQYERIASLATDDYADRFILSGYWGASFLWVELDWEGQDPDAPFTLPNGRELDEVIGSGEFDTIADQVWLSVSNSGKAGDILWTTSMAFTVISTRMLDILRQFGGVTLAAFPLATRRERSPGLHDYHLVVVGDNDDSPVRRFPAGRRSTCDLDVHAEVLQELRRQGVDRYRVKDAQQYKAELAEDLANEITEPTNQDASLWDLRQQDAPGTPLNAWWFEDSGQLHRNVDHFSGIHAYPVTVQAILR